MFYFEELPMSKRPILSLNRETSTTSIEAELTAFKKEEAKPKFDQVAFEKKARKERMRRYRAALNVVESLKLPMPLAKGVGRPIVMKLREQGISSKAANWAMQMWTHSDVYLNAVINGKCRFNLDGTEAELISDAEREYSRNILESRNLT
tara:strand:+ start:229 stop:678 length:450 start_codon:yes stop_codon:yes gene_type:complete